MLIEGLSISINLLIVLFISLLNSSTNALLLYLLSLTAFQNFCTNFFIIFSLYSILLSSTTFTDFSSPPPNSFLNSNKNSLANLDFASSNSKSSNKFFFYISADLSYIYDNTYCICFSTIVSLIFILRYNLYVVINPPTFSTSPLNTSGLATLILDPMLGFPIVSSLVATNRA